ncbi:MAG: transposase [Alphaproteobacteria bacterium]|nr:transposase [Alphaproteobacteria bacterium]
MEEAFGWTKTIGDLRKTRYRRRDEVHWAFTLIAVGYNLIRLPKLLGATS